MYILAACFAFLGIVAVLLVKRNPTFTAVVEIVDEN